MKQEVSEHIAPAHCEEAEHNKMTGEVTAALRLKSVSNRVEWRCEIVCSRKKPVTGHLLVTALSCAAVQSQ